MPSRSKRQAGSRTTEDQAGNRLSLIFSEDDSSMKRLPAFVAAWRVRPSLSSKSLRRRRSRPVLEALERREVLSTYTWNGTAGDTNWGTDGNWVGGTAPTTGPADITFPNTSTARTITIPT